MGFSIFHLFNCVWVIGIGASRLAATGSRRATKVKWIFSEWDSNDDGLVTKEEFKASLKALCDQMSPEDVEIVVQAVDKNKDGNVDVEEFLEWVFSGAEHTEKVLTETATPSPPAVPPAETPAPDTERATSEEPKPATDTAQQLPAQPSEPAAEPSTSEPPAEPVPEEAPAAPPAQPAAPPGEPSTEAGPTEAEDTFWKVAVRTP